MTTPEPVVWRQGRRGGHHVYRQLGPEPSDSDPWVGSFVDPADAARAVAAVQVGRCGARGGLRRLPAMWCTLPAGHAGWHRDDVRGGEWRTRGDDTSSDQDHQEGQR